MTKNFFLTILLLSSIWASAQSPGGVSTGLRTWYKADAVTGLTNGQDMALWADQATADGVQNAVQNGLNTYPYFGNRQPQFRTPVSKYNFNPYIDFSKYFASLYTYQAQSTTADYRYNFTQGATLYQVGDLSNNRGWYLGTGLGATTAPIAGNNYEYGYPWWGLNQQYYGVACGYYYGTVDDYFWYQKTPEYNYNYARPERKTQNNTPYISSISYDKYGTNNGIYVASTDATTALQTRVNGDKWSWGYNFTPAGPSLFIGNELTNYNAGRWWKGGIPEVILYNRKLNTAQGEEADRVDSYLGLKYGVTLLHNYYLSDGIKVWDTAVNNQYNNQIAGVGKDAASALNQKQSHSILKKAIVTMSLGALVENNNSSNTSVISDKYTMVWGTNGIGGSSRDSRTIPGGYAALPSPPVCLTSVNVAWSAKKWMVQEQTGKDVGAVNVYIESSQLQALDWSCQAYIVVGSDANLSNPVYYPLSLATGTASATDYVASINFCEGASNASTLAGALKSQYFAVVGKGPMYAPGGVLRNLAFWVRADMGTINDSTSTKQIPSVPGVLSRVRQWQNQAKGADAYAGIAGDAPTLRPASRYDNFHTMVSFYDYLYSTGNIYPSPYENYDPDFPTMIAKNIVSNKGNLGLGGAGADSLSMFCSHRNLADWYNSPIGVGYAGRSPGIWTDGFTHNSVEYTDVVSGDILASPVPNFTSPYNLVTATPYGLAGYNGSSSFGRSYQSAMFWYPRNPNTITYLANNIVDMALRGNGANLPMATQSRNTSMTYYGSAAGGAYNRTNVALGGGDADYSGCGLQDAILYTGGFIAADNELERIETYLGIRNGLTIRHNYYATDKTVIWDTTAYTDGSPNVLLYSNYNKSITGIGRDDAEAMQQRVSRNVEDTVVTISLNKIPDDDDNESVDGEFANDKEYLVWGSNGGTQTRIITDLPVGIAGCVDSRLAREYHLHLTGASIGTYKTQVRWQLDNNILDPVSATSISLLIDDDGDGNFATGIVRSIPATSYDGATNSVIFDNVTWTTTGDTDPANAAMTVGWGQTSVAKVILYNNTAAGGGNCTCNGASSVITPICTDASLWTYYKNPASTNKVFAINWGANTGVTATVTLDASSTTGVRRKTHLNTVIGGYAYDSAATLGARMVNISIVSGTITSPVAVRFYYDSVEFKNDSTWIVSGSTVGSAGGSTKQILSDSTWQWFKFEGTVANAVSNLTASGLVKGDGTTANTYTTLTPDVSGKEDGVNYVQFSYLTSFSTIGYLQTYVKNNNLTVLPLSLLDFNVMLSGSTANVFWSTADEVGIKNIEVERSLNGGATFETIGSVAGKGGNGVNDYTYYDDLTVHSGKIFYRLKINDMDGNVKYGPIKFVSVSLVRAAMEVLPNPFSSQFSLVIYSCYNENVDVKVLSMEGQQLYLKKESAQKGSNVFRVNLPMVSAGTYYLQLMHEDGSIEVKKIVKM